MSTGFDLSPVIGLLRVLPSRPSSPADSTQEFVHHRPVHDKANEQQRDLGDFSALWRFLKTTADASDTIPAANKGQHDGIAAPRRGPRAPQRSPKKLRRVVTFAATVDISDDAVNTASDAFISSTGLRSALDAKTCSGVKAFVKHVSRPEIRSSATPEARRVNTIQKLVGMFPEARATLFKSVLPMAELTASGVHVFIDNSNILIGFYDHIKKARGFGKNDAVRRPAFSFYNLSLILERGRGIAKKVLVGSSPITPVILEARELGYETSILERVEKDQGSASSGSESAITKRRKVEQAVDEICHLKILESVLDYAPSTIVLASGDGAAGEYSPGFFKVIERCLVRGWAVELVAFKKNLSGFYKNKEFKKNWENQFRFVALDGFAEDLLA